MRHPATKTALIGGKHGRGWQFWRLGSDAGCMIVGAICSRKRCARRYGETIRVQARSFQKPEGACGLSMRRSKASAELIRQLKP